MKGWKPLSAVVLCALLAGCSSSTRTPITISITPTAVTVNLGSTQPFVANVSGTSNTGVTWSVNDVAGGNATVGTISTAGLYTAPTTVPNPPTVTVKATSSADPSVSASAQVTIESGIRVQVFPATATVGTSETVQFQATVTGTATGDVTWSVNDVAGGNANIGTISSTGLYTAPATPPSPSTVNVKATSTVDATRFSMASVGILAAASPVATSISPTVVAQGSLFQDLYVIGAGFFSTSRVRVGGTAVPTTFVDIGKLRARVPQELLAAAGTLAVDVQQQSGTLSAALNLSVVPVRPALVAASPDSATQGGGAVSVSLNGGYFSSFVTAEFDGKTRAATVTNSRQLNVALSAADVATAGLFSVVTRNPAAAPPLAAVNLAVQPSAAPSVLGTTAVGTQPAAVAVNTSTGVAVVANRGSNNISVLDLATRAVTATIPVGTSPTSVAVDNERNLVVVANNGSSSVSVVDLAAGSVRATISGVGSAPFAVGVNPLTGLGIVVNQSTNSASVIDLATNTVTGTVSISTGANPAVSVEPRLNWAVVTPGGAGTVSIVDLGQRSVVATVTLGITVRGVAVSSEAEKALMTDPDGTSLLLFSVLDQTVSNLTVEAGHAAAALNPLTDVGVTLEPAANRASVIDLRTPVRLGTISVGTTPRAVAIDPGTNVAVVANEGSNNVTFVSLGAIRALHITQISPATTFTSASSLTLTLTGSGFAAGSVVRINEAPVTTSFVSSRRLTATVPASLLSAPRRYVVDVENSGPVRSNVADFAVLQAVAVGTAPRAVAIDPERDVALVTNSGSNNVSLVDLNTGAVTSTITVGTNPQGVAVLPRAARAVVTNRGSNTASVLDLAAGSVKYTVNVGTEPLGVAINPDTGQAVVANTLSNTLSLFTAEAGDTAEVTTQAVDQRPVAVAINPTRNLAAVLHTGANNVAIVNLNTPEVSGRISGFQIPTGAVYDPVSDRFLVLSSLTNNFAIVDPVSLQAVPVRVGINPTSMAYNFQSGTLVTVNTTSKTVSVMDFIDRRVRAVLGLVASPQLAVDIHPRTNLAVIVDEAGNRVLLVPLPR